MGVHAPAIVRATINRIARTDLLILFAVLTALVGSWAFLEIADEMAEGETQRLDAWVVRSLRKPVNAAVPIGPRWLVDDVQPSRRRREVGAHRGSGGSRSVPMARPDLPRDVVVLGAAVGGQLLGELLKIVFARPRPDIVPHLTTVNFSSFPSGRSMSAAAVYLTLGLLLARFTIARGSGSTSLPWPRS